MDLRESLIEKVLTSAGQRWEDAEHAARLKCSLEIQPTLEQCVETRSKQILANTIPIKISVDSVTLEIADLRKLLRSVGTGPLNTRRDSLIDRAIDAFWSAYRRPEDDDGRRQKTARSEFVARVRPQVERAVESFWPRLDFAQEYRKLLCDPVALANASKKRFGAPASAILEASLSRRGISFQA
jgi:hypothetical protein